MAAAGYGFEFDDSFSKNQILAMVGFLSRFCGSPDGGKETEKLYTCRTIGTEHTTLKLIYLLE